MYFDTLKLSSVEQSASSTSAKGGKGNSELITWNFGKEITVNLTDALYTPASLSLLWGGRFGSRNTEINGFWNPIHKEERKESKIVEQRINWTKENKNKIKICKEQIKEFESVINQIYQIIHNAEKFLCPNVYIALFYDSPAHAKYETTYLADRVYELTNSYFPIADYLQQILAKQVLEDNHAEDMNLNNYTYTISFQLDENDPVYEAINNIYDYYHIHDISDEIIIDKIPHPISLDELLIFRYRNLKNYLNIFARKDYSEHIRIKYIPTPLDCWSFLSNRDLYNFDDLVLSCRDILYSIISSQTIYKNPIEEFPINILLENYQIYQEEGEMKFKFIYDESEYDSVSTVYTYTSEYLGYNKEDLIYPYIININDEPIDYSCNLFLPRVQKIGQPAERAKIILKSFSDFNTYVRQKGVNYHSRTLLNEIGINGKINFDNREKEVFYEYEWKNCEIQMLSLEGNEDVYYAKNVNILYRINSQNFNKKILIKMNDEDDYYDSQLDFYSIKNIIQDGKSKEVKVKVGTFYINDSFNFNNSLENSIYSINSGISELYYLDRTEKCKAKQTFCIDTHKNFESNAKKDLPQYQQTELTVYINPHTMEPYQPNTTSFVRRNGEVIYGNLRTIKEGEIYYKFTRSAAKENEILGDEIIVTGKDFPGTYKLVASTYTRARVDGKDSRLQIEIPRCTIIPESSIELNADGEPVTFNMKLKVMKNELDEMIKIQKFDVEAVDYDGNESGSNKIIPIHRSNSNLECDLCRTPEITFIKSSDTVDMDIVLPQEEDFYCFVIDCLKPFNGRKSYLKLPTSNNEAAAIYDIYKRYKTLQETPRPESMEDANRYQSQLDTLKDQLEQKRDNLLIKVPLTDTVIQIDGIPYLIARNGGYEYYDQDGGTEETTEVIDGKTYRIAFITQENLGRFSPIKFTFTGVNTE